MFRHPAHTPSPRGHDRWVAVAVLAVVLAAYAGIALGLTHLGSTPHGRSLQAAAPFAILPR